MLIGLNFLIFDRERTEEEVEVLARLNHPNIVHFREGHAPKSPFSLKHKRSHLSPLFDYSSVVRTPKFYVIVMEILSGGWFAFQPVIFGWMVALVIVQYSHF